MPVRSYERPAHFFVYYLRDTIIFVIVKLFSDEFLPRRRSSVVERGFHKAEVAGSIPAAGTIAIT